MSDWKTYPQEVPEEFERITFYSHSLSFYFIGSYSGFKRGTNGSVGEVWSGESVRRMRTGDFWKHGDDLPPPHSPESTEPTPLAETAATAATGDDEITAEKLRAEEGWEIKEDLDDSAISGGVFISFSHPLYGDNGDSSVMVSIDTQYGINETDVELVSDYDVVCSFKITTMSELHTLIRWLS